MNKALDIIDVSKDYNGKKQLTNFSLSIDKGDFHALIGKNGAGKSTLIKMILGITSITSGKILIDGIDCNDEKSKASIGYVPDKMIFPSLSTVKSSIVDMCFLSGQSFKECRELTDKLLEEHKFTEFAHKHIKELSAGQQKKVLFLQSIVHKPNLLILDEPTTNLDPVQEVAFFEMLLKLNKEETTILLVSHKLALVEKYAKTASLIDEGKIAFTKEVSEFKNKSLLDTVVEKIGGIDE